MRLAFAIAACCLAATASGAARAGDTADSEILGFSADGGLFAFQEYGVQDGSGFPYATTYVIDTDDDSWAPGTPLRVRLEDDGASLLDARRETADRLDEAFGDVFDPSQAVTLAHSPLGEAEANPVMLGFAPLIPSNPLQDPTEFYEARLDIFHTETQTEDCVTYIGDRPSGFRLTIHRLAKGGQSVVLHEDGVVPRSRGCPITYRLSEVVVRDYPPDRVAVLVSVFTPGFEGPDRRFIAVTGRLPD